MMQPEQTTRSALHPVLSTVLFILLTIFLCYPAPYGNYGFLYFGLIPAPFAHWILATILYVALIVYVSFVYDPYKRWNERLDAERAGKAK